MAKSIANPEPSKVISRASDCLRKLMDAGLTYDDLQKPIDDPEMRKRLVERWKDGALPSGIPKGSKRYGTPEEIALKKFDRFRKLFQERFFNVIFNRHILRTRDEVIHIIRLAGLAESADDAERFFAEMLNREIKYKNIGLAEYFFTLKKVYDGKNSAFRLDYTWSDNSI